MLTLTAPSFGRVHSRAITQTGKVIPCACGEAHRGADTRLSTPIDPDTYDYVGAVLWHANVGTLWHRFTTTLRRRLAQAIGLPVKEFKDNATVSYSKVAEYQKRGMVHFHAVIRVDGPDGPGSSAPDEITMDLLTTVVTEAARETTVETKRPDGTDLALRFGDQIKPEPVIVDGTRNGHGRTEQALAGYIAKYATKSSGVTDSGVDRRIKSREHIDMLSISEHYRRMMLTAWDLGEREQYAHLNLHRWVHMLGFRGHFLTKSQKYSTTFKALRSARARYRFIELLDSLNVSEEETIVISEWDLTGVGHRSAAEREIAAAIAERMNSQSIQSRKELKPWPVTKSVPARRPGCSGSPPARFTTCSAPVICQAPSGGAGGSSPAPLSSRNFEARTGGEITCPL